MPVVMVINPGACCLTGGVAPLTGPGVGDAAVDMGIRAPRSNLYFTASAFTNDARPEGTVPARVGTCGAWCTFATACDEAAGSIPLA